MARPSPSLGGTARGHPTRKGCSRPSGSGLASAHDPATWTDRPPTFPNDPARETRMFSDAPLTAYERRTSLSSGQWWLISHHRPLRGKEVRGCTTLISARGAETRGRSRFVRLSPTTVPFEACGLIFVPSLLSSPARPAHLAAFVVSPTLVNSVACVVV